MAPAATCKLVCQLSSSIDLAGEGSVEHRSLSLLVFRISLPLSKNETGSSICFGSAGLNVKRLTSYAGIPNEHMLFLQAYSLSVAFPPRHSISLVRIYVHATLPRVT